MVSDCIDGTTDVLDVSGDCLVPNLSEGIEETLRSTLKRVMAIPVLRVCKQDCPDASRIGHCDRPN